MSSTDLPSGLSQPTRRALLQRLGGLSLSGLGLNLAALSQASAVEGSPYKALVCVFLQGGNDAYNTVLATDGPAWQAYQAARGGIGSTLALAAPGTPRSSQTGASVHAMLGGVLPVVARSAPSRGLALHPVMGEMAELFSRQRLAVVANVGPLAAPTTKAAWLAGTALKPRKLFSHNDQTSTWQTLAPEGSTRGWGGRMADLLLTQNQRTMFTAISAGGNTPWLEGSQTRGFQLAPAGAIRIGTDTVFGSAMVQQKLLSLMTGSRSSQILEREVAGMAARSIDAETLLRSALPGQSGGPWATAGLPAGQADPLLQTVHPVTGESTPNPLAMQLQVVARMIAARSSLGLGRQVFFVSLPGFDTHDTQAERHALALARLSQALAYFDTTLTRIGVDNEVTTFTASEFGRNLSSNGDGCDHGWGGHQFVMGGAVRGGDVYGQWPGYGSADGRGGFNSPDQLASGALLPTTPVESLAATLGQWLGLSPGQMLELLPGLQRWDPSARSLGFMA